MQQCVALCDGCAAWQTRIASHFPDYSHILDFIHANEYLWDVANALLGEDDPKRLSWMMQRTRQLLSGETERLIAEFRALIALPTASPSKCSLKVWVHYRKHGSKVSGSTYRNTRPKVSVAGIPWGSLRLMPVKVSMSCIAALTVAGRCFSKCS